MQTFENVSNDRRIIDMQENHDLFIACLILLLDIIKNKTDNINASKLLQDFNDTKVDINRQGLIIKKIFMLIDIYFDLLKSRDIKLFNLYTKHKGKVVKVTVIPSIDIGSVWDKLDNCDQNNIWKYIEYMYISSSHMVNASGNTNNVVNLNKINEFESSLVFNKNNIFDEFWEKFPTSTLITNNNILDPYIGVGKNISEYGIDDLLSGPQLLPDQTAPGVDGITKLFGIDRLLNIEGLTEQLKNITKEQIEQASISLKSLLGDVDENTSEFIDLMLTDITEQLNNKDIKGGSPINNLFKIAECVAQKIAPVVERNGIDMTKVYDQTKNMASKCCDEKGNPMFSGPNNPISMITNMMEAQMSKIQQQENNGSKKKPMTEEEYAKECQNMLGQLGLPNIPIDQLKNLQVDKLMNDLNSRDTSKKNNNRKYKYHKK